MRAHAQNMLFVMSLCVVNIVVAAVFGHASPLTGYMQGLDSPIHTLFTTHFTHFSHFHLITNLAALWMLMYLFPNKIRLILVSFLLCIILTAGFVLATNTHAYLGFSALLYCLPGIYLFNSILAKKYHTSFLILVILYVYLYMIVPMNTSVNSHWQPMTTAHLIGFLSGFVTALINPKTHEINTTIRLHH